jgi:tellurite resistance protein TehA-like permease
VHNITVEYHLYDQLAYYLFIYLLIYLFLFTIYLTMHATRIRKQFLFDMPPLNDDCQEDRREDGWRK